MKLTCPNCFETLSLAALIEHDAAREAVRLALEFPAPLGKLLLQYAGLFKPAQRSLSMDRFASILNDLLPMIQAAQIERSGRIWSAPLSYWQQAFEAVWLARNKLTLPLKSHGYLLEIIVGFANKVESKQEQQAEQGRQYGREDHVSPHPSPLISPSPLAPLPKGEGNNGRKARSEMPEEVRQTLRKLTNRKETP